MTSTDVGVGSTSSSLRESESSNLATVPRIMYRSLQQTTIPGNRAGGVTNDRIPLQRLNDDEYDEVNLGGGENASEDLDEQGQREAKKRSKRSKRKRKLSEKAPSALDEK